MSVCTNMHSPAFTPLEESISFYTRNDFAILNHLLVGNLEELWTYAELAYNDNRGILAEYASGVRRIQSDYDRKWIGALQKRILPSLDEAAKETILRHAKEDIANIIGAMYPAKDELHLYRTAWIDDKATKETEFPYSREYKALHFDVGSTLAIQTISSCSLTPYREEDDVGSDFYRYEIRVMRGLPILELDALITHNEDGEVVLPPMLCRVIGIRKSHIPRCRGIIDMDYMRPL